MSRKTSLIYRILKFPARCLLHLYCRKLSINRKELLQEEGPLLIAANHPNSFLDALILATLFDRPIYSLARGDAFSNKIFRFILRQLNILPVFRLSEGANNLNHNYNTFDACKEIFRKKGIVLIFSEGLCINEWHLRNLKKGTARLAISSWDEGIPLKVLPLGINYSPFYSFGKNVFLKFGNYITKDIIINGQSEGKNILLFNQQLIKELHLLVMEIDSTDKNQIIQRTRVQVSTSKKCWLFFPGAMGFLLHVPIYLPLKLYIRQKLRDKDHFDSLMVVGLLFIYPLYLIAIALCINYCCHVQYGWMAFLIFPFFAWSFVQIKPQN